MNEFKGTPEPWTLAGDDSTHITDSVGRCIVDVPQPNGMPWSEERANAALILAARDLLEALKLAREYVADELNCRRAAFAGHEAVGCVQDVERDLDIIDAAIAKALGGKQEVAK